MIRPRSTFAPHEDNIALPPPKTEENGIIIPTSNTVRHWNELSSSLFLSI